MFDLRSTLKFSSELNSNSSSRKSNKRSWQRKALRHLLVEQLENRRVLAAPHPLALGSLNGTNGFRLDGINGFRMRGISQIDYSGYSVAGAGDINGDGYDDLIIGAGDADTDDPTVLNAGESYILFGKSSGFASSISLGGLASSDGFRIEGIDAGDNSGQSVAGAGDVNGDGFDDLIIGAPFADPGNPALSSAGESYVIFGKSSGFGTSIALSNLNGTNGFHIEGIDPGGRAGLSVASAGDVNGDGLGDLLIGAPRANPIPAAGITGESYVVFGRSNGFGASIAVSSLNGTNGFRVVGAVNGDFLATSVSSAGDVNGDGFDDLIIGAYEADPGTPARARAGESYVVFGKSSSFASVITPSNLDGSNGFRIEGADVGDLSGRSVASAGDVNGDGFDDLIIGATGGDAGDPLRTNAGESYVVFGKSSGFASAFSLSSLNGTNGFRIDGVDAGDKSGISVSSAGDVNGDGFGDLIIGAYNADPGDPLRLNAGESYVVFGGNFTGDDETQVGTNADNQLVANRAAAVDVLIGGQGNDSLLSDGGSDVLIGGQGNDVLEIPDVDFSGHRRIVGGTGIDTLRLNGNGLVLNLSTIADNRLIDIEVIDLTGGGDNTLILNQREVLNLSGSTNLLVVDRNYGDEVIIGTGWMLHGNVNIGVDTYHFYSQGAALLMIQHVVPATVIASYVYHAGSSFASISVEAALDHAKVLAQEGATPQLLTYDNLINTTRGINGLVFDIANLPGNVTAADFEFQMSPQFVFDQGLNPPNGWESAPAPLSVSVLTGSIPRVVIVWPDNAIANRWLRVTVKANGNTGLASPDVYYLGHLLGETTGGDGTLFSVAYASDIVAIRAELATNVDASSTVDIDKNGLIQMADIVAMRSNTASQLMQITIPAAS